MKFKPDFKMVSQCSDNDLKYWNMYWKLPVNDLLDHNYFYRSRNGKKPLDLTQYIGGNGEVVLLELHSKVSTPDESAPGAYALIVGDSVLLLRLASRHTHLVGPTEKIAYFVYSLMPFQIPVDMDCSLDLIKYYIKQAFLSVAEVVAAQMTNNVQVDVLFDQLFKRTNPTR